MLFSAVTGKDVGGTPLNWVEVPTPNPFGKDVSEYTDKYRYFEAKTSHGTMYCREDR